MKQDFLSFATQNISNFVTATTNIFMFLPYFFSVRELIKTLFAPWKNLQEKDTKPGFSFDRWFNQFTFNATSRMVGATVRLSLIFSYLLIQSFFVVLFPFIFATFLALLPAYYLIKQTSEDSETIHLRKKEAFVRSHLLQEKNKALVEAWFQSTINPINSLPWWHLKRLMSVPPLGRDFTAGYTPTLDQYSIELTTHFDHYKHLVGREAEIKRIEEALIKSRDANIILVGDEGVGKHTIVESLAKRIWEGSCHPLLAYKRILRIDMEKILSKEEELVKRQQILKDMLLEAQQAGNIIIFLENIDQYTSDSPGRTDMSTVIAEYAKGTDLQFLAITTPALYQKYLFNNDRIARLFEKIDVEEVSKEAALQILLDVIPQFEKKFSLTIPYETACEIVHKSDYYVTTIPFPEKALHLLDETASKTAGQHKTVLTPDIIGTHIEEKTHIPTTITDDLSQKLLRIESELKEHIIGQDHAMHTVASAMQKAYVLDSERKKPIASFLFLGPTGVGKTETAKAINTFFFQRPESLVRFDMSLYQSKENIAQLVGSDQTGQPGLMTSALRENPYGVLLLDEIEKAEPNLLNIFLTLLDEGYYSDGTGEKVDCRNLIVIATSNAGADVIYGQLRAPEGQRDKIDLVSLLVEKKLFSPEFLNRFDAIIIYNALSDEAVRTLARKMTSRVAEDLMKSHGVTLTIADEYLTTLIAKGYNPEFGARDLARVIQDEIEHEVAKQILEKKIEKGGTISF